MAAEDAELVRRWRKGDPLAFDALVRRWEGPVLRILTRLLGESELVEDSSQEVFLRVYHATGRYRDNGTFSTWLYRIALNVARDVGRRRRRRPVPLEGHEPPDRALPAEKTCQQREAAELVAEALSELPEPLREALVLRHYEGLNFEEIARLTGTPASTVKSRFGVALRRMRSRLQELGYSPEETPS